MRFLEPRFFAVILIVFGVTTFGALHSEAGRSNLGALSLPEWSDVSRLASSVPALQTIGLVPSGAAAEPQQDEADLILPLLPSSGPTAPVLPQPGPALSDRMAQAGNGAPAGSDAVAAPDQEFSAFGLPCGLSVNAEATPGAMVALDVMDPCRPDARVVIEHSGLTLTARTDAMGIMTMDVPVFESPAFFNVRLSGDISESALIIVPDLADYHRVGVQWNGDRALELHALEFGADYGESGHIWADQAGNPDRAITGAGGFMVHLGDATLPDPKLAQIYTFPHDTMAEDGVVRLSIEAPITDANCGQDTLARTLETEPDGGVAVIELTFTMPGCDAVGDYLVLQNLLQDLRVAAN